MTLQEITTYLDTTFKPTNLADAKVALELLELAAVYSKEVEYVDRLSLENRDLKVSCKKLREQILELRGAKDDLELGLLLELECKK